MSIVDIFRSRSKDLDENLKDIGVGVGCTSWRPKKDIEFLRKFERAELEKYKAQRMKKLCEAQDADKRAKSQKAKK